MSRMKFDEDYEFELNYGDDFKEGKKKFSKERKENRFKELDKTKGKNDKKKFQEFMKNNEFKI